MVYLFKCKKYTLIFTARNGSTFRSIRNLLVSIYFRVFNVFLKFLPSALRYVNTTIRFTIRSTHVCGT